MQRINALWNRGLLGKAVIVLGVVAIACCVIGVLVPRRPAQQGAAPTNAPAAAGATAAPQPTEAPAATAGPTSTPEPTATPKPTDTPEPTATPSPIPATATPIPPIVIKGKGQTVTDKITVPYQLGMVAFTHDGQRNFVVQLYTANDDRGDLLVNTIGNYAGIRLFQGESPVFFEITADGPWELSLMPLIEEQAAAMGAQGGGDWVTGVFVPTESGPVPYRFTHTGERNFAVYLHCDGKRPDLVQNEIGAVENEAVVRFSGGLCFWEIQADGDWTIAPK